MRLGRRYDERDFWMFTWASSIESQRHGLKRFIAEPGVERLAGPPYATAGGFVDSPAGPAGHRGRPSATPSEAGGLPTDAASRAPWSPHADRSRRQSRRGAVDAHACAGAVFNHPEPLAQHHRCAALFQGEQFPAEISSILLKSTV